MPHSGRVYNAQISVFFGSTVHRCWGFIACYVDPSPGSSSCADCVWQHSARFRRFRINELIHTPCEGSPQVCWSCCIAFLKTGRHNKVSDSAERPPSTPIQAPLPESTEHVAAPTKCCPWGWVLQSLRAGALHLQNPCLKASHPSPGPLNLFITQQSPRPRPSDSQTPPTPRLWGRPPCAVPQRRSGMTASHVHTLPYHSACHDARARAHTHTHTHDFRKKWATASHQDGRLALISSGTSRRKAIALSACARRLSGAQGTRGRGWHPVPAMSAKSIHPWQRR